LNEKAEDKKESLYNLPFADTDILIVETPNKDGEFVFINDNDEIESQTKQIIT
jgi:hypothetical protein